MNPFRGGAEADCITVLTPELASRMLGVWERRQRHTRNTRYDSSVLEAALYGLPDFLPDHVEPKRYVARRIQPVPKFRRRDTDWMGP